MLRKIGKPFLCWMVLSCAAVFAEPVAVLKVVAESFVAGRPFDAVLLVKGNRCEHPEWSGTGFSVVARGVQTAGSETNRTHSFSYRLVPLHPGKLLVPTFWVTCDDQELETDQQVVTVQRPVESPDFTLTTTLSAHEVFVGQPFRYVTEWHVGFPSSELRAVRMSHPLQSMSEVRALDVKPESKVVMGLPVGSRRVMASVATSERDGKMVTTYRFEQIVVPNESGEFEIAPIRLLCSRVAGSKGSMFQNVPSYFDNSFFEQVDSRESFREYYAESQPVHLLVKPLPVNDQDQAFSGLVGMCELQTEVAMPEVKVGDPVQLTVRLNTPFAQALALPDFRQFEALARRFWIPETQSEGVVADGARTYRLSVRPLHTGVQMVPPLELQVFNPVSGAYELVQSEAVALRVLPNEGQTRFVPPEQSGETEARVMNAEGVWFNRELSVGLGDRWASWAVTYWYLWVGVPLLIGGVVEPFARRRRLRLIDPQRARALRAYSRFKRRLVKGDALADTVFYDYLAERFGFQCGTVTRCDVEQSLVESAVSTRIANEVMVFMAQRDQEHFSSHAESRDERKQVADLVRKLESEVAR